MCQRPLSHCFLIFYDELYDERKTPWIGAIQGVFTTLTLRIEFAISEI